MHLIRAPTNGTANGPGPNAAANGGRVRGYRGEEERVALFHRTIAPSRNGRLFVVFMCDLRAEETVAVVVANNVLL